MTQIVKQLAGMQDLAVGRGPVTQERNGQTVGVDSIDVALGTKNPDKLLTINVALNPRARLYDSDTSYTEYLYDPNDNSGLPSSGTGTWIFAGNVLPNRVTWTTVTDFVNNFANVLSAGATVTMSGFNAVGDGNYAQYTYYGEQDTPSQIQRTQRNTVTDAAGQVWVRTDTNFKYRNPGKKLTMIAHRFAYTQYPQNTILGMSASIKDGYEYLECDVQWSSEGTPWLFHDSTLDATTNGTGSIANSTDAYLDSLKYTVTDGSPLEGIKLARMSDVLNILARHRVFLSIGLKGIQDYAYFETLINEIISRGLENNVGWNAFDIVPLQFLRERNKTMEVLYSRGSEGTQEIDKVLPLAPCVISGNAGAFLADPSLIEYAQARGCDAQTFGITSVDTAYKLMDLNMRRFIADFELIRIVK